jgi:hypothetical protein
MLNKKQSPIQVKEVSASGELAGYASVFGVKDQHGDIVVPGAFEQTIAAHKAAGTMPKLLYQHDTTEIIGEHRVLREDAKGLYFEALLYKDDPAIPQAAKAYSLVKRGQLDGVSIGFSLNEPEVYDKAQDAYLLTSINLWENSLVTFGSNHAARVESVKTSLEHGTMPLARDVERALREIGFSTSQSKKFMSGGYKLLDEDYALQSEIDRLLAMMRG